MTKIYILSLLLLFLAFSDARFMSGSVPVESLQKEGYAYISKFAMSIGVGSIKQTYKFSSPIKNSDQEKLRLNFVIVLDEEWEDFLNLATCEDKFSKKRDHFWLDIPTDGSWSSFDTHQIGQKVRSHVWYFFLFDCEGNIADINSDLYIEWEQEFKNSDGSHFSQEENGILGLKEFLLCIFLIYIVFNILKFYKFYKDEETFDYPGMTLIIILALEFWSMVFDVIHLSIMEDDGKGSYFCNFSSLALNVLSQYALTCLLLLLASGWTFKFMSIGHIRNYFPSGVLLGLVQIYLMWLGTDSDDAHDKYHDFENISGALIILVRLGLYTFFLYLLNDTYRVADKDDKTFLKIFGLLGTVYFMAFPVLVVISSVFVAPYLRHKTITIGSLFFLIFIMMFLTKIFTSKKNKIYNNLLDVQKMLDIEISNTNIIAELSA